MTTTIRFNTGGILYPWFDDWPDLTVLEYMAANGIEIKDSLVLTALTTVGTPADTGNDTAYGVINNWRINYRDNGIKVWAHIEASMVNNVTVDTTDAEYRAAYNACMALYEAEGSYMVGFSYETGFDTGAVWLYARAHAASKKVSMMTGSRAYEFTDGTYGTHDITWRLQYLDEILYEIWELAQIEDTDYIPADYTAINEFDSAFPQGVFTRFAPQYSEDTDSKPWSMYLQDWYNPGYPNGPQLSWDEQHRRASEYLPKYKPSARTFDVIEAYPCSESACGHSVIEQVEFLRWVSLPKFAAVSEPPTYRMWARNWDYGLRQPVFKWNTMDLSLKYCDISTCVLTMQTSEYLETWYDSTYTPVTERTWIQNYTNGGTGGGDVRYLKGTGIVIWRNDDVNPIFNGMISGFKRTKLADGTDTCEITFSSDELLLLEHIAFPDILTGSNQRSGQLMPDANGIWGYAGYGDGDWGSQWATDYNELADSQEAQMKYFVQDQIGAQAAAGTNRKLSVLKTQPLWNSSDAGATGGYGDDTLLSEILTSIFDLCKYCVVPQPASDSTVFSPDKEIQFFIRYLTPPDGVYYLEFCTQTATNTAQRTVHADVDMGEHDKRTTCVFSEQSGTVVEVEYEELRPELNQSFVIGPTPNADTYASTSTPDGNAVMNVVTGVDFGNQTDVKNPVATNWDVATDTVTDITTDIDHRLYKLVTGEPVTLSQDVYGVIEGTFEHSTGEGVAGDGLTTKQKTLKMMKQAGRSDINEKLFNIYFKATVRENDVLTMSPDTGMQNFYIGDYVKVITEYGNIENLVREINIKVDSNGEVMETIIGTPMAAYGNWWTGTLRAERARRHARRTSRHHYHRSK